MKEFKCRASAMGLLMTNGRGKDAGMGETAKSFVKDWFIEQITGKSKDIESKYFDHGNYAEKLVLKRASNHYGVEFKKNKEHLSNEFFTGTFDAKSDEIVIDAKAPFDAFSFPYFKEQPPKEYYHQLQVYMSLTGLKKAVLFYGLENHSKDSIDKLASKIAWKKGKEDPDIEDWDESKEKLTYDNLPNNLRQRVFEFDRDDNLITEMEQRVIEARKYINEVLIPQFETNLNL
jgi:hypothetical protein